MMNRVLSVLLLSLSIASASVLAEEADKPKSRYDVPKGDVAALVTFIEELQQHRPTTTAEILEYRKKAVSAFEKAADRIRELEKDKTSEAYRLAGAIKFQLRLNDIAFAKPAAQQEFYDELLQYIVDAKTTSQLDIALANTFCQILEQAKNNELAIEAFAEFGGRFSKLEDEKLAAHGERMVGVSRRLGLPGSEMKIEGTTVSGDDFDWKSYQGKVVLVDFWATWCGPCVQELPNLKENYTKYHDKGFEVVGISLDENRDRLRRFLSEREVPWECLFEDGAGWNHPMVKYYGINATPTTILIDREGKVVAMNIHRGELGRQLAKMFGPSNEVSGGE